MNNWAFYSIDCRELHRAGQGWKPLRREIHLLPASRTGWEWGGGLPRRWCCWVPSGELLGNLSFFGYKLAEGVTVFWFHFAWALLSPGFPDRHHGLDEGRQNRQSLKHSYAIPHHPDISHLHQ